MSYNDFAYIGVAYILVSYSANSRRVQFIAHSATNIADSARYDMTKHESSDGG